MVFDDEATGQSRAVHFGQRTRVNIENARASAALKMFVMAMLRRLEARFARRQNDLLNLFAFLQQFQRAINRGDAQSFQFLGRFLVNFGDGKRSRRLDDDLQNRVALPRLALTDGRVAFDIGLNFFDNNNLLLINFISFAKRRRVFSA